MMNKKGQVIEFIPFFFLGMIIGGLFLSLTFGYVSYWNNAPTDETVNDICKNLSGGNSTEGYIDGNGKLVCTVPSYDHATNIIIKTVGDE